MISYTFFRSHLSLNRSTLNLLVINFESTNRNFSSSLYNWSETFSSFFLLQFSLGDATIGGFGKLSALLGMWIEC